MENRSALLISSSEYQDATLSQLASPKNDVASLADVLRDPSIGNFGEVTVLTNEPSHVVKKAIEKFFDCKKYDDLILLYFSGHGVLDLNGRLYLASLDTECGALRATAISARYLTEVMDDARSRRIVLILDCCHSGAFSRGGKGAVVGTSVGTGSAFEGMGHGKVVLTASDATQYAWEGDHVEGSAITSVFTNFLVQGLRTGAADLRQTGKITVDDLYRYIHEQIMQLDSSKRQTPGKWSFKQEGEIIIGRNPNPPIIEPEPLPNEIQELLHHPVPTVRLAAVNEIEKLLTHSHDKFIQSTATVLEKLKDDDSKKISEAARKLLSIYNIKNEDEKAKTGQGDTNIVKDKKVKKISKQQYWFIVSGIFFTCCVTLLIVKTMPFRYIIQPYKIIEHQSKETESARQEELQRQQAEAKTRQEQIQREAAESEKKKQEKMARQAAEGAAIAKQQVEEAETERARQEISQQHSGKQEKTVHISEEIAIENSLSKMLTEAGETVRQTKDEEENYAFDKDMSGRILNEQEIKVLILGKMVAGKTIDKNPNYLWIEAQRSDGYAYFLKQGDILAKRGRWTIKKRGDYFMHITTSHAVEANQEHVNLKHDAICWCYFAFNQKCNFECKYIIKEFSTDSNKFSWYYIHPENENKTSSIIDIRQIYN